MATALLAVIALAGTVGGLLFLFNVRGAADKAAERRNAVRAAAGARTMQIGLAQESRMGPSLFRYAGGVVGLGSLLLLLLLAA
ncbi:hypothetical protein [Streptomyces nitrosporeus]|uniref:Uncharacterized protein n=1 Tax=Streptomyces nitrosporeus TaxID=28894 RepID=A0A5J6FBK3_9ACTN|nr:hypothetical protein [Streptomyces nitrosporeus]QEU73383.1 hypothetical protein CP967_16530 [Streptomyces nitrosporeus]GGZ05074.1 hypothetical protein GCM10010327_39530 [Streptomyces nitrosporeus]